MRLPLFAFVVLPAMAVLSGCAMFNKYDYRSVEAQPPKPVNRGSIAVAVVDIRHDLLIKEVDADYVGMTRNHFGIPFRVTTKSKAALADDLSAAISKSLRRGGWNAHSVSGYPISDTNAAFAALRHTHASRYILVTVREWESDTLIHTDLTVNVDLDVLSPGGRRLATANFAEAKSLGGSMTPVKYARERILDETAKVLTTLLKSPGVRTAL